MQAMLQKGVGAALMFSIDENARNDNQAADNGVEGLMPSRRQFSVLDMELGREAAIQTSNPALLYEIKHDHQLG